MRSLAELDAQPDAAVFFHDYHLYLAPRFVRERGPDATLAHFVHIPWPQPDFWHVLPERDPRCAIHDGLLANDVVGFHAHRWRRSFLRSSRDLARRGLRLRAARRRRAGGRTLVAAQPISVDPREFEELARERAVLEHEQPIAGARGRSSSSCASTAPTRRRTSSAASARSSSISTTHPEMHGRVGMLALLDPSRQDIPEYAEYLGAIQRAARVGQRPLPARRLDSRRSPHRGQLPADGGRVQAVRRAARERDLRRPEPRRQGRRRS